MQRLHQIKRQAGITSQSQRTGVSYIATMATKHAIRWVCIAVFTLLGSTLSSAHQVKPPPKPTRSRKLQIDQKGEPEMSNFQASDSAPTATESQSSQMDKAGAWASGCGGRSQGQVTNPGYASWGQGGGEGRINYGGSQGNGEGRSIYGGGHGSGGTIFGIPGIFPLSGWPPLRGLVPEVSTWGEGGGYGGSIANPGTDANCPCTNRFPMHYIISTIPFQPIDATSLNTMSRGSRSNAKAPSPPAN